MGLTNNLGKLSNMITSTGSAVGIAQSSPAYTLDVYSASGYTARLNGSTYGGLILANAGTANTYLVGESTLLSIEHTTAINLRTNNADRVRIASTGNVGIGTTNTTYSALNIKASGTALYNGISIYATNGTETFLGMGNSGTECGLYATYGANGSYIPITFSTSGSERMRITSGGDVGIGTSTPTAIGNGYTTLGINGVNGAGLSFNINGASANSYLYTASDGFNFINVTGSYLFYNNGAERMRITNTGAVMVGTSSSVNVKGLFVGGTNSSYLNLYSNYSGGAAGMNITNSADVLKVEFFGSTGNYYFAGSNISDRRAKSNIQEITVGLSKISLLKPSTFTYDKNPDIVKGGFIAQEVLEVIPEFVTIPEDENEMMGVDYFGILALAVKAIQELSSQNQDLKSRLDKAGL